MKSRICFTLIAIALTPFWSSANAQNRTVGANKLILDDALGRTLTIQTPAPMPGPVGSAYIYNLPIPPAGNPPAGFVRAGASGGQTLYWNSVNLDWEASSVITNNTNGNGTSVLMTAPVISNSSITVASPTASANTLVIQAPSAGNNTTFQARTQASNIAYTLPAAQGSAGQVLSNDGTGGLNWTTPASVTGLVVPEVVNFLGSYSGATAYAANDLVTSASPDIYYYSLIGPNSANTPETSPAAWQVVTLNQLNTIHKVMTLPAPGFTPLMSIEIPTGSTFTDGGRIQYTIRATDGGAQIATEEGIMQYIATANSITCTTQVTDKLHLGTVNSGCTPGFYAPGFHPGVSIFDNVAFSVPAAVVAHDVYFRIFNVSGQITAGAVMPIAIRLEP